MKYLHTYYLGVRKGGSVDRRRSLELGVKWEVTWAQPHAVTFLHYITLPQGPHLSNEEGGINESGLFNSEILGLLFLEPKAPSILNDCRGLWL